MTHASHQCDCGNWFGLPAIGSRVEGMTCGNCSKFWKLSDNPNKLIATVSEWRCPNCNTDKARCRDNFWNKDRCKNQD